MSDEALGMLKHMRRQIVRRSERCVAVRGAAISIGVDPGGSECPALVEELLRDGHLQRYPSHSLTAHGLYRLTYSGISAADEADSPTPLRERLRKAYRGLGGAECLVGSRVGREEHGSGCGRHCRILHGSGRFLLQT